MNCLEFRRLIFADPGNRNTSQESHLASCPACAALTAELVMLDDHITQAASVPLPNQLADRVLLRQRLKPRTNPWVWALAASLLLGLGLGWQINSNTGIAPGLQTSVVASPATLGQEHPAVAAIAYVTEHEPRLLLENRKGDPAVLQDALRRLGINLPATATVIYLGKCPVPGGTGEHVVLETPTGKVTLILAPGQSFGPRIAVTDHDKTAVAHPVRSGGYILVSDSLNRIEAVERLMM